MSKDKHKSLPRRLALLVKCSGVYGYAVSREGRPPLSDSVVQDCIKRGLVRIERQSSPGLFYNGACSRTTKLYLTALGHAELKKHNLWDEFHAVPDANKHSTGT